LIWLESFLAGFEGAILITSHDREFLNRVVGKIIEIDAGELTTYSGDYEYYVQQRALADQQQQAQYERQQAMLKKEIAFIERFKARASHAAQVQSRIKKLDKIEKVEPPKMRKTVEFEFGRPPRSGEDVARLSKVSKSYGSKVIYRDFDFLVRRAERWCVLGGGEKARVVLARMLFDPPNFLVLDEPTNHLDLLTKEMLINALRRFEGAMLFVSHDRHFLAELSTRVLELTPEGPHLYGGGYTEYVSRTGREAPGLRS